jgi:uncharacterized protein (TIGR02421 family)
MNTLYTQNYFDKIKELSDAIVSAQSPIRILDAIKWGPDVKAKFFQGKFKQLPEVTQDFYFKGTQLNWIKKRQEFHQIERSITKNLGQYSAIGHIMRRICREYNTVLRMLEARGTPEFSMISQQLYGSALDVFHVGDPNLAEMGTMMVESLIEIDKSKLIKEEEKLIPAEEAIKILQEKLNAYFHDNAIRVIISDGIIADAAAGADYIKIRKDAFFNERELRVLEVHEGWVHLATTINGLEQPYCTFLGKGPPSSTVTQEGLAILMEIFTFVSTTARLKRLANRIRAVEMVECGANFLELFEYFRVEGFTEDEAYSNSSRVFRGSLPTLGPFTKDLSYCKGFIEVYNLIQLAVKFGKLDRISLLFCGKTTLEDVGTLSALLQEGIVVGPKYLPPQIADLNALSAWMCFSNFLNKLSLEKTAIDYKNILN